MRVAQGDQSGDSVLVPEHTFSADSLDSGLRASHRSSSDWSQATTVVKGRAKTPGGNDVDTEQVIPVSLFFCIIK